MRTSWSRHVVGVGRRRGRPVDAGGRAAAAAGLDDRRSASVTRTPRASARGCSRARGRRCRRGARPGTRPPRAAGITMPISAARRSIRWSSASAATLARSSSLRLCERGAALERAADARSELQHLNLHRDDPGEHHAEQRDPGAAADDAGRAARDPGSERTNAPRAGSRRAGGRRRGAARRAVRSGRGGCAGTASPRVRRRSRGGRRRRRPAPAAATGPETAARRPWTRSACGRLRLVALHFRVRRRGDRGRCHVVVPSSLRAARRCADFDRGLAATSPGRRRDRATGQQLGLGLAAADADRKLGRADAAARAVGEEPLDAPVLERVERDRGEAARRGAAAPTRSGSAASSCASSSLTAIRSAWNVRRAGMAAGELGRHRDRGLDRVDELLGRAELLAAPRARRSRARSGEA